MRRFPKSADTTLDEEDFHVETNNAIAGLRLDPDAAPIRLWRRHPGRASPTHRRTRRTGARADRGARADYGTGTN
jgi:hypothetical protein